ncbi:MAG TPA: SulP family inorganic anion transporter [Pyrinomonadaceae bacterium]|nr:SulP family inorganic anion transporter [Pyrinomonadaceae bacterium]
MTAKRTITDLVPGLETFRTYQSEWLRSDLVAGLSVAAVALPIGIAYAQLAGFPPVVGIYSCILPLVAYALFGSSRQLVVNPDAAACAIVAATVGPLALGNAGRYLELSIILTSFTGLLLIAGGLLGFGVIANFLSRPILTGYLNGIAVTIIAGQLGTLLGFAVPAGGFFRTVGNVVSRLGETHATTLILGASLLVLLLLLKRLLPKLPGPLIVAAVSCIAVFALALNTKVVGAVPAGFPAPLVPHVNMAEIWPLVFGALGIGLVSFCSMMTTARGFAAKNGYRINVNQDMFALGVSDLASAFNRGFVVSGADSRTAVADSSGGKTQVTSLTAAAVMALVLLFLVRPLAYVPTAALAAILVSSALGLFDFASLRYYYRISGPEFRHSMVAMLGVMTIGVLPGVLIAVGLALLNLLRHASRPNDSVLGIIEDEDGADDYVSRDLGGTAIPGLIIYRFESSIVFFNSDYFSDRVHALIRTTDPVPRYLLLDAESVPLLDISGAYAIESLRTELAKKGIVLGVARASALVRVMLEKSGVAETIGAANLHSTIHAAVRPYRDNHNESKAKQAELLLTKEG